MQNSSTLGGNYSSVQHARHHSIIHNLHNRSFVCLSMDMPVIGRIGSQEGQERYRKLLSLDAHFIPKAYESPLPTTFKRDLRTFLPSIRVGF
jgi:hypothetical protein